MPTYQDALRDILRIPALETESAGATRVVRCLFTPPFHPECSLSIVETVTAIDVTVRAATRSVSQHSCAQHGWSSGGDPVRSWVEPAVSIEVIRGVEAPPRYQHAALAALDHVEVPHDGSIQLDGIILEVELWSAGRTRTFTIRGTETAHAGYRVARTALDIALDVAQWDASRAAIRNVLTYVR
ncbi:MAG: hypothetical protein AB7P03_11250 [Kofleriaceae bacterium]